MKFFLSYLCSINKLWIVFVRICVISGSSILRYWLQHDKVKCGSLPRLSRYSKKVPKRPLKGKQWYESIRSPLSNVMPAQCAAMYHCLHVTTLALTSWCGVRRLYKHWPPPGQWMCLPSHRYRSHGREMAGTNTISSPDWRVMTFENMTQGKLKLRLGCQHTRLLKKFATKYH